MISGNSALGSDIFAGSRERTDFLWDNLILERSIPVNWIYKIYKKSILKDFWSILSSAAE
jgi:hypothetical protein